ncbi:hypothetical protein C8J56DRAFT_1170217 [Mycena floridula]|nr:hypothetical protein C8J56DRAFT_1170217 [Mycena floridula]
MTGTFHFIPIVTPEFFSRSQLPVPVESRPAKDVRAASNDPSRSIWPKIPALQVAAPPETRRFPLSTSNHPREMASNLQKSIMDSIPRNRNCLLQRIVRHPEGFTFVTTLENLVGAMELSEWIANYPSGAKFHLSQFRPVNQGDLWDESVKEHNNQLSVSSDNGAKRKASDTDNRCVKRQRLTVDQFYTPPVVEIFAGSRIHNVVSQYGPKENLPATALFLTHLPTRTGFLAMPAHAESLPQPKVPTSDSTRASKESASKQMEIIAPVASVQPLAVTDGHSTAATIPAVESAELPDSFEQSVPDAACPASEPSSDSTNPIFAASIDFSFLVSAPLPDEAEADPMSPNSIFDEDGASDAGDDNIEAEPPVSASNADAPLEVDDTLVVAQPDEVVDDNTLPEADFTLTSDVEGHNGHSDFPGHRGEFGSLEVDDTPTVPQWQLEPAFAQAPDRDQGQYAWREARQPETLPQWQPEFNSASNHNLSQAIYYEESLAHENNRLSAQSPEANWGPFDNQHQYTYSHNQQAHWTGPGFDNDVYQHPTVQLTNTLFENSSTSFSPNMDFAFTWPPQNIHNHNYYASGSSGGWVHTRMANTNHHDDYSYINSTFVDQSVYI